MTSKMTKQNGRGCLSTAVLPRGCENITIHTTTISTIRRYGNLTEKLCN